MPHSWTVHGRIGQKPEFVEGETPKCNFSIATPKPRNRETGEKDPQWTNVTVWGDLARYVPVQYNKGDQVCLQGVVFIDEWKDKTTGEDRHGLKMNAFEIGKVNFTVDFTVPETPND